MSDQVTTVPNPVLPGHRVDHLTHNYGHGTTVEMEGGEPGKNADLLQITRKQGGIPSHMFSVSKEGGVQVTDFNTGETKTLHDPALGNQILAAWNEGKQHPNFPEKDYAVMERGISQTLKKLEHVAVIERQPGGSSRALLDSPKHVTIASDSQDFSEHGKRGANGQYAPAVGIVEVDRSGHNKNNVITAHQDGVINVNGQDIHDKTLAHNIISTYENAKKSGQLDMSAMQKFEAQAVKEAGAHNAPQANAGARGAGRAG